MTHEQARKRREQALRQSQLDLYHALQGTLNEISEEMLGTREWQTALVDRSLEELQESLTTHFGDPED